MRVDFQLFLVSSPIVLAREGGRGERVVQRESSYGVAEEERVAPWHTLEADLGMTTYATLCLVLTARVTYGPRGECVWRGRATLTPRRPAMHGTQHRSSRK